MLAKMPFAVERILTDKGQEFGSALHWHIPDKGTGHVYIEPRTPRLNTQHSTLNAEGSHRIDPEAFYRLIEGQVIDDAQLFTEKFQE